MRNDEEPFEVELTVNKGRSEPYQLGDGYGHLAVSVDDLDAERERMAAGRAEPGAGAGAEARRRGAGPVLLRMDPDGYKIEVLQRGGRFALSAAKTGGDRCERVDRRVRVSRRNFLRGAATAMPAAALASAGMGITAEAAWAAGGQGAAAARHGDAGAHRRDIYPHDHIAGRLTTSRRSRRWDAKAGERPGGRRP